MMSVQVVSIELNEVNFDLIERYVAKGELPHFAKLLREHRLVKTVAEKRYRELEPWIQWPTVYTGKSFAEHGIFRLGDCVGATRPQPQIWEQLEQRKVKVGAISPMNARNDCLAPAFFLPDPWTDTPAQATGSVEQLFTAVKNIVNDNAHQRFSARDLFALALHGARHLRVQSAGAYLGLGLRAMRYKWARAIVLDRMLADLFVNLWRKSQPGYASLFLNAAAHIQHHHLYDSAVYEGDQRNPEWYATRDRGRVDPVLTVYRAYDRIIADLQANVPARMLITTGLSQQANPKPYFQYRPVRHAELMAQFGVAPERVVPRMSRDFSLFCASTEEAEFAARRLAAVTIDGSPMLVVESRGEELFCQIGYRGPPEAFREAKIDGRAIDLHNEIVLVSIENSIHRTTGYHLDCGLAFSEVQDDEIPLAKVFDKTLAIFDTAA